MKNRPFSAAVLPSRTNLIKKNVIFEDEIRDSSIIEIPNDDGDDDDDGTGYDFKD